MGRGSKQNMVSTVRPANESNDSSCTEPRSSSAPSSCSHSRASSRSVASRIAVFVLLASFCLAAASPAFADRYDKRQAGHPLRIVAYVIYPIGALLDVVIMRPAHWLVSQEPFASAVGHD